MTQDVNTVLADMPCTIRSYVVANVDLTYTIVINSRLSHERQRIAWHHEMQHIKNGDYDRDCSSDLIEFYAHN